MANLEYKSNLKRSYLLIGIFGLVMVSTMGYSFYTGMHMVRVYVPWVHAVKDIKNDVTTSHLWLEEILSGDENESMDTVRSEMSKVDDIMDAMLFGEEGGDKAIVRANDPDLREWIFAIKEGMVGFRELAEQRVSSASESGPGSLIDEHYDAMFDAFLIILEEVEERLKALMRYDLENFRITQVILIATSILLIVFVGFMMYLFERKQKNNFLSLRDANKKLEHEQAALQQLTAELEQHREHLENLVDERTTEVRQALIAAEESNQAKTNFLSCMSHELRTPLNAILGFSQLLSLKQDDVVTEDDKSYFNDIHTAGTHLLELINEILDLAKIEAGYLDIETENIALDELLSKSLTMIKPLADKQGIHLNFDDQVKCDDIVCVDYRRFMQVILNLLSNAVKYNRADGDITLSRSILDNGFARVIVKDTGLGIGDDYKPHIFEPFERAAHKNTNISGTGIGLVITKNLIEAIGGNIGFESELNQGSTFWVDIPLAASD